MNSPTSQSGGRALRDMVFIATSRQAIETDPDLEILTKCAEEQGLRVTVCPWNDSSQDWSRSSLTLIRSCWDYYQHVSEFKTWAKAQPNLQNPLAYFSWNLNKHYLRDLAALGIPSIETVWNPRSRADVPNWERYIVKPTISASANGVSIHVSPAEALYASDELIRSGHEVLLQPYLNEVESPGEISLTFFEGERGISLRKAPPLVPQSHLWRGAEETAGYTLTPVDEGAWATAEAVLNSAASAVKSETPPLYARVDLVPVADVFLLMELELIEPALFLFMSVESTERLVAGLKRRLS